MLAGAIDDVVPTWLYDLLLARKGVLAERQGLAWLLARQDRGATAALLDEVRQLRAEAAHIDLDGAGAGAITRARRHYAEALDRLAAAEVELMRQLGASAQPAVVRTADVQARVDAGTGVVDLVAGRWPDGEQHYVAIHVAADGPLRFDDLGPAAPLNDQLSALVEQLATPPHRAIDPPAASGPVGWVTLTARVLADRVVVAPTGLWGRVPIGAMPDELGRPLLDRHEVDVVPSVRWWVLRDVAGDGSAGPPVVLGDPDFDLDVTEDVPYFLSMRLPRLQHAAEEARAVADELGVAPVLGRDVTRSLLLGVHRPRVLHVATHGSFLDAIRSIEEQSEPRVTLMRSVGGQVVVEDAEEDWRWLGEAPPSQAPSAVDVHRSRVRWLRTMGPAGQLTRSALLLTGFNRWLAGLDTSNEVGTGVVTASELALLDLSGTELVVLSACETGVAAVDFADGTMLGLRTAALAAGAAQCVSSLWEVDDEATTALMRSFYGRLRSGSSPAAALRAAQLDVRERRPEPYYWAGWLAEGSGAAR
ncbi:CHAT domain-containing protein [Geodermatophilus sp. SYSU D00742]